MPRDWSKAQGAALGEPEEPLLTDFQSIETTCDVLRNSFDTIATLFSIVNLLATLVAHNIIQEDDTNESFVQAITIAGSSPQASAAAP
ncbi:hypothetical protein FRC05_011338 [Tulasnella sp. 425]|nr:hypothetical protein FRC05_011338 [Tulasnella sp. 425]